MSKFTLVKSEELENCRFVKTILMIVIVFYHSIVFWTGDWFTIVGTPLYEANGMKILAQWLAQLHNRTFVLVSGYIYYYIKCDKGGYNTFSIFLKNKFKRLIVPFIFGIVWAIPFSQFFYKFSLSELITNFFLGVAPSQMWFLLMLFGVFIIGFSFTNMWKNSDLLGLASVLLLYVSGSFFSRIVGDYFQIPNALQYSLVFFIGFKLRQKGTKILYSIPLWYYLLADTILFLLFQYLVFPGSAIYGLAIRYVLLILHSSIGSIMVFVILQSIASRINWHTDYFNKLIKSSMSVYLLHQQFIFITIYLLNGAVNPYINALINFVVAFVLSLFLSFAIRKNKITRILVGEKD